MYRSRGLPRGGLCFLGLILLTGWVLEARSILNFPFLTFEKDTIVGVAIVNLGVEDAQVEVTAYGFDGQLLQGQGIENPVALEGGADLSSSSFSSRGVNEELDRSGIA